MRLCGLIWSRTLQFILLQKHFHFLFNLLGTYETINDQTARFYYIFWSKDKSDPLIGCYMLNLGDHHCISFVPLSIDLFNSVSHYPDSLCEGICSVVEKSQVFM